MGSRWWRRGGPARRAASGPRAGLVALVSVGLVLAVLAPVSRSAAGPVADDLADRLVTVRPDVGDTWVVSLPPSTEDRILARTLQGVVNRSEARVYLLGPDDGSAHWLAEYQAQGLVSVAGTTGLDGALDRFAAEASGYVVADLAEPWTVQAAATVAAAEGAVVAFPSQVPGLAGRGLVEVDDLRGRWSDAATAYEATLAAHRDGMPAESIAVLGPGDTLFDFTVQQGIPVVWTRPSEATWPRVRALLEDTPPGSPVYGYLSTTGEEEAIAVGTLSAADLVLVPTDTTRNLSFHLAVGSATERVPAPSPDLSSVAPCTADTLNVVVAVTDGDNLNVPLNHFVRPANWTSPRRGELPIAWSMSPAMAVLAPAAWDAYAREAGPTDELVAMAGWGYGAPALAPSADAFYADSFALMDELGLRTFWSLGGGLETPLAPGWDLVDDAAGAGVPDTVLVSYGNGVGDAFWSPAGRPAFTSRSVYEEAPADLAGHVADLLATPADERPLVSFLSATNWTNPVDQLVDALAPFEAEGVRFLTPAEAGVCLPDPPEPEPPVVPGARSCAPDGPITAEGLALITAPAEAEITSRPASFGLPTEVEVARTAVVGDVVEYRAVVRVDVPGFAAATLAERVRPVVAAGYGLAIADTAWVSMAFDALSTTLAVPAGTVPVGEPTVTSTGPPAEVAWRSDGLTVTTAAFSEDTRSPGSPFELEVRWSVLVEPAAAGSELVLAPGPVRFGLALTIGVLLGDIPLLGTVSAPWRCAPDEGVLASTSVAAPPTTLPPTTGSAPEPAPPAVPTRPDLVPGAVPAVAVVARPSYAG